MRSDRKKPEDIIQANTMKEQSKNIIPAEGLGRIQFGMTREVVRKIAGEPDEIEAYQHNDEDNSEAEAWHYDEPEVSFAFEEFNDWKLTSIAISSDEYRIKDRTLLGLSLKEVIPLLQELNLGEISQEDHSDNETPDVTLLSIDEAGLNLWFEGEILTEIQFSQVWEDEEH